MTCNTTNQIFFLSLQRRRIDGNAEVRPLNVTATPSAKGGESDVKYLTAIFIYHNCAASDRFVFHNRGYAHKRLPGC